MIIFEMDFNEMIKLPWKAIIHPATKRKNNYANAVAVDSSNTKIIVMLCGANEGIAEYIVKIHNEALLNFKYKCLGE